ncbi:MAG: hypothetical protein LBH68_00740 [Bifidobacteriaceae bacterium]|jgi:hypothetical protein|nr:hypothetical protein [Bifidobacteriaceae bacterium]
MSKPPIAAAATALVATFALITGCTSAVSPAAKPLDLPDLRAAVAALTQLSAACVKAPPEGWSEPGLVLLSAHSPEWLAALPSPAADAAPPATASPSPAPTAGTCSVDRLVLEVNRVETLALRLATADPPDLAAGAIWRAVTADQAIARSAAFDSQPPPVADLADLPSEVLADLALAEDQAGFLGEYLAANLPLPPATDESQGPQPTAVDTRRTDLAAAAAMHRDRGEELARMSGAADRRAPAYQLPDLEGTDLATRWGAGLRALASHYAAVPAGGASDPTLIWLLVQAHQWGAELPALPFLS